MKPTQRWNRALLAVPAVLVLTLAPARAQTTAVAAEQQLPFDIETLQENLESLLRPNDSGKLGSGEKDSLFRQKIWRIVVRGDLKIVPNLNVDGRGKGNDDLVMNPSASAADQDAKDAAKDQTFGLDVIAGLALDLDLGQEFEAVSLEYKKNLLDKPDPRMPTPLKGIRKFLANEDFTLKIAGFTIRCPDPTNDPSLAQKDAFDNGALLKNGIKAQFWAGVVPIIVRGNAGACLNLNMGPVLDTERMAFGFEIEPAAYVHGWLSAGIGVAYGPFSCSAGIAGKLRLIDTTVPLEAGVCLHPDAPTLLYASLSPEVQALKVEIQLFAQLQIGWASRTFTWSIYTVKLGKNTWKVGLTPRDVGFFPAVISTPESLPPPERVRTPTETPVSTSEPRNQQ